MKVYPQGQREKGGLYTGNPVASVGNAAYVCGTANTKHSRGHINCPLCEPARAMHQSAISPTLLFEEAIDLYLDMRRTSPMAVAATYAGGSPAYMPNRNRRRRRAIVLLPNTDRSYVQYGESLKLFFTMPLEKIHLGNLVQYQKARLAGDDPFIRFRRPQDAKPRKVGDAMLPPRGKMPCPVQAKKVNQELGLLQMLLKHAGAWTPELDEHYALLDEDEEEVPRALTPEEQEHWLHIASASPDTEIVFWYSLVAFETLNSTDELRGYRVGDWNLQQRIAVVRRGKVRARERTIQITDPDALWAMERLLERAAQCGSKQYTDFIFPLRGRGPYGEWDPGRPMSSSGMKRQWNLVRERSGLTWFRQYDPRHTGITRLAEEGVPIAVIKDQAGHITDKMSRHYTHISEAAQRRWKEFAQQSRWARRQPAAMKRPPMRAGGFDGSFDGATVLQAR